MYIRRGIATRSRHNDGRSFHLACVEKEHRAKISRILVPELHDPLKADGLQCPPPLP
jgi:hypothetical protein